MRRLLFRGRTKNGRWRYGDYVHAIMFNGVRGFHKDWIIPGVYGNGGWVAIRGKDAVDGDTVGQYTGLTDKNGVKIFEGDIVSGTEYSSKRIGVIVWIDSISGFGVRYRERQDETAWENSSILKCISAGKCDEFSAEVIGNIYDNPELWEVRNESSDMR